MQPPENQTLSIFRQLFKEFSSWIEFFTPTGQTLDKKIADGPLKLDEAVDVAVQISEILCELASTFFGLTITSLKQPSKNHLKTTLKS